MNLVVVEDDINMRKSLEIALGEYEDLKIKSYKSAVEALKKIDENTDLVITDINMPGMDGIEFIKELNGKFDVIIMTGNATLNKAIESMRLGVKDFLTKPFDAETLYQAIKRTQILKQKSSTATVKIEPQAQAFVAKSQALQRALNIHQNSLRKNGPFIAINMSAIPENLIESELFGFEKGAFTDASAMKKGQFELADGGTLFLDEIGEMPASLQPKLLRALQEREITRLGATKSIKINVRIVSATNANLPELIRIGKFREDLFYRLNTVPIVIPPLRERKEEIATLARDFLEKSRKEFNLENKKFSSQAIKELEAYDFPGNVRELISIVQRAAILSDGEEISGEDLFLQARSKKP